MRKINNNHPDLPPIFPRADHPSHSVTPTTPDLLSLLSSPSTLLCKQSGKILLAFLEVTKGSFKPRMNRSIRDNLKAIPHSHALYHRHACSPAVLSLYSHGQHIPAAHRYHTLLMYLNTIDRPHLDLGLERCTTMICVLKCTTTGHISTKNLGHGN